MNTELLDIYSDYLISQGHYATATGLAATLDGEIRHDQVSRFLRAGDYGSKNLWEYISSLKFVAMSKLVERIVI